MANETKVKTQNPEWVNAAGQANYETAKKIASRPYVPYTAPRIAGFTGDQKGAMGMLRDYAPRAGSNAQPFKAPRLIDSIGENGNISDYMNPEIDNVLNRTQQRIRQSTNMAKQWQSNMGAHQDGAFGDARHGIADAQIEERGIQTMGDAAAEAYAAAYDNAQGLRQFDINNLFSAEQMTGDKQQQLLQYIDALYRSGSNQQSLDQQSMTLSYEDFLRQLNYPLEQYNMLVAGLTQTPYDTKTTTKTPEASTGAKILGAVGNIASTFI